MRDGEYIALRMYKDHLNTEYGSDVYSMSSVLRDVMFGFLPPIPKEMIDIGMDEAEKVRRERKKSDPKKEDPQDPIIGGGIFTF